MLPLQWYRGIAVDVEAAKEGKGVVLHCDENVCRVMSYNAGKLSLCGYASKERCKIVSVGGAIEMFEFAGHTFCAEPCYLYETVDATDADKVQSVYRRFLDNAKDTQMDMFIQSRHKTKEIADHPLEISADHLNGRFALVVTYDNRSLGQVSFSFRMKDNGRGHRVVEFNKKRLVNDVYRLLVNHGNPPAKQCAEVFVNNVLSDFANQLKLRGVEFDPSLFDG